MTSIGTPVKFDTRVIASQRSAQQTGTAMLQHLQQRQRSNVDAFRRVRQGKFRGIEAFAHASATATHHHSHDSLHAEEQIFEMNFREVHPAAGQIFLIFHSASDMKRKPAQELRYQKAKRVRRTKARSKKHEQKQTAGVGSTSAKKGALNYTKGRWRRHDGKHWRVMCQDCKVTNPSYGTYKPNGKPDRLWCKHCATTNHADEYKDFTKVCEDCHIITPAYGVSNDDGTQSRRWCRSCAEKNHAGEYEDFQQKCEDCQQRQPSCGTLKADGSLQRKWCLDCAQKNHGDDYVDGRKTCEDCHELTPSCGTYNSDGTKNFLWCKTCAVKNHADEYEDLHAKCEDCHVVRANYGIFDSNGMEHRRWCHRCADKNHADEYVDFQKKCEDCGELAPSYGVRTATGTIEVHWCRSCATQNHADECVAFPRAKCAFLDCGKFVAKDGYCVRHHPAYVETGSGFSKVACRFMHDLEKCLKLKEGSITHKHIDAQGMVVGEEYRVPDTRYRVDGYLLTSTLSKLSLPLEFQAVLNKPALFIEFLGDEWHGHPSLWHKVTNHVGLAYEKLYAETFLRFEKIKTAAPVLFIWESEYRRWDRTTPLWSCCNLCT